MCSIIRVLLVGATAWSWRGVTTSVGTVTAPSRSRTLVNSCSSEVKVSSGTVGYGFSSPPGLAMSLPTQALVVHAELPGGGWVLAAPPLGGAHQHPVAVGFDRRDDRWLFAWAEPHTLALLERVDGDALVGAG